MITNTTGRNGLTLIVIEDNIGDYILVEDFLYENFKTLTIKHFTEYKAASVYFQNEGSICDLILLDLHLPDMKGLELIKNMIDISPKTPIIILTGYADLPLAKKSLELGVYDFLLKDEINPTLIHKSIEFALSRSRYVQHIESQNEKLKNIAWTQSHVVRAPLARILGIIEMIDTIDVDKEELPFWLSQLKVSSNEMDDIVRSIIMETQTLNLKNKT